MTLNLTLVTPKDVYECSDFRLTYTDRPRHYTDVEAQKIIVLSTLKWSALLQFAGVAKTSKGFDTTEWLAKLVLRVQPNASIQFIVSELLAVGRQHIGQVKHSFVACGFEGEDPFIILVSNFQCLPDTRKFFPVPKWTFSTSNQKHIAFATGSGAACVKAGDLRNLLTVARRYPPLVVQQNLAAVNKAVAKNPQTKDSVSESCFTGHLPRDGAGELIPHDVNPGGEYLPGFALRTLTRGTRTMDLKAKVDSEGRPLPRRLVQIALKRGTTTGRPIPAFMFVAEFSNIEEIIGPAKDAEDPTRDLMLEADRFHSLGDYAQARPLYERVLEIREKALGPGHPDTAESLNNLAVLLQAQGDFTGARPLFERALSIRENVFGPGHPGTAESLNNLAGLLRSQGNVTGARPMFERALVIREKMLGPQHPDTAASLVNLASLLQAQGELVRARRLYRRALKILEKVLGPEHPDTAKGINNLAGLLQAQGDLTSARLLFERALRVSDKAFGPDHPNTATSLNNLAGVLQAQGNLTGARPLFERALAIKEKVLDPRHPDTATGLNNLALLLQAQGDLTGARPLLERALFTRENVLGPDHPGTAESLNNLALLLQAQGNLTGARPLLQRALPILQKALGPDHPTTVRVRANLAALGN
jgi:tetratricopeptide (TPR) repeat protein